MDTSEAPHKVGITVAKHFDGNTNRPPDEVVHVEQWFEGDGSLVTDPIRMAELEAQIAGEALAAEPVEEVEE
jgi:hypothetical protein